jgi:hypothetical protein
VSDEPSLGELGRLIQLLRGDVREDMAAITARLDKLVSADVYAAEKEAIAKDISDLGRGLERLAAKQEQDVKALQEQRSQDANRVTQTRRYLVASVIIPILGLVIPVILFMVGGKS